MPQEVDVSAFCLLAIMFSASFNDRSFLNDEDAKLH